MFGDALAERLGAETPVPAQIGGRHVHVAVCGFGLAAAGSGAAWALAALPPDGAAAPPPGAAADCRRHAYLAGIAGTYRPRRLPVGRALVATSARCVGIGAGAGPRHRSAGALGWAQGLARPGAPAVLDVVELDVPVEVDGDPGGRSGVTPAGDRAKPALGGLLSVTAASGSRYEARRRAATFPDAVAEEMEAFAVALACRLAGVPLTVVRGISNVAGDRDPAHWQTAAALDGARRVLEQILV